MVVLAPGAVPSVQKAPRRPRSDELETSWAGPVTWRETTGLRDHLYDLLATLGGTAVRLNVRKVTEIDAAGVALLLGANTRAAATGRRLVLIDTAGPVTQALSRMHMHSRFTITQVIGA